MLGCGKKSGQPDKRFLCKAGDGAYIGSGPHVFIFAFRNIFCGFLLAAGVPCAFGLFGPPRKSIPSRSPDRWVPGRMRKMSCCRGALRVWAVWTAKEKHPPRSPERWAPGRPGKIFFRRVPCAFGLFGPPRKSIPRVPRAVGPRADQGKYFFVGCLSRLGCLGRQGKESPAFPGPLGPGQTKEKYPPSVPRTVGPRAAEGNVLPPGCLALLIVSRTRAAGIRASFL